MGVYTASYHFTHAVSPEGSVSVAPNMVNSSQGNCETFTCMALGGPGNMFSWTRLYDNMIVGNMSNLTVRVNSATDGGQYRCDVSNLAGNDSDIATLNGKFVHSLHVQNLTIN